VLTFSWEVRIVACSPWGTVGLAVIFCGR